MIINLGRYCLNVTNYTSEVIHCNIPSDDFVVPDYEIQGYLSSNSIGSRMMAAYSMRILIKLGINF